MKKKLLKIVSLIIASFLCGWATTKMIMGYLLAHKLDAQHDYMGAFDTLGTLYVYILPFAVGWALVITLMLNLIVTWRD